VLNILELLLNIAYELGVVIDRFYIFSFIEESPIAISFYFCGEFDSDFINETLLLLLMIPIPIELGASYI
jgi:hypothetical protein